ncbi:2,3-bisphosphoglycerate-independent phosphoglycerate mutase [Neorickettsia risticii]|uniref:2,3-bisphosphoglycerate-independent phosphoglycerate mutase n=1 Tax=Neorickettsia risticii (strain Illinois) TaxID=434131 RepID=C6V607_NEORI|nr:2,3-bisphosphoglycerate-independent phosphoglycerate mutase [Neorickettsia risticii]ACT69830.1 2,3-bisphosphoglycerate-independent phosphoglycerate mutase [Neorickettsia risticii str. Illinois]
MPLILCILDGWGVSPQDKYNAVYQARTPHYDTLLEKFPHSLLSASSLEVGLPEGQMGNSEVGHMTIGSGRIIYHDLVRINHELEKIDKNPQLNIFANKLKGKRCHLVGLLSDGGVHSHVAHINKISNYLTSRGVTVCIHAFLDGRDTAPKAAKRYITEENTRRIATLAGRYYGMDRDKNWDRTVEAYRVIVKPTKHQRIFEKATEAIGYYYAQGISDEFIPPSVIGNYAGAQDGDGLFIANFRPDRARQITSELIGKTNFCEDKIKFSEMMTMSQYFEESLPTLIPRHQVKNTLSEIISGTGMYQLKIAETEKYAHVSYFFNGGKEAAFPREERILINSPRIKTYDLEPKMAALEITDALIKAVKSKRFDFIVVNYANADMVGHTGNMSATIEAVETLDICLGKLYKEACELNGYEMIVTSDHGNAECMYDHSTKLSNTAHTTNLVPFIVVSQRVKHVNNGGLYNIAGTVLKLLGIEKPTELANDLICFE